MDWKKFYLSPKGRVNRKQFWLWFVLPAFGISMAMLVVDMMLGTYDTESGLGVAGSIFSLMMIIPAIFIYIKRYHDRDKSGWWCLILFIPIIGAIWFLIEQGFLKGTDGPNRFGPPADQQYSTDAAYNQA